MGQLEGSQGQQERTLGRLEGCVGRLERSKGQLEGSDGQPGETDKRTNVWMDKENFSSFHRSLSSLGAAAHKVVLAREKELICSILLKLGVCNKIDP